MTDEAAGHLRAIIELDPGDSTAHTQLGTALARKGRLCEAIGHFRQALKFEPHDGRAHNGLGAALARTGELEEAIDHLRIALGIRADLFDAHYNLARALTVTGRPSEALNHYRQALRLKPDSPVILGATAWILATHPDAAIRDGPTAIEHAERAAQLTENPMTLDTLAAAYAEAGDFDRAAATARRAMDLAAASSAFMVEQIRRRIELYERAKPYRESPAGTAAPSP